ncbi:MAG: hypothetical protein ACR2O8_03210 [Rhizobiaceae bacterium]
MELELGSTPFQSELVEVSYYEWIKSQNAEERTYGIAINSRDEGKHQEDEGKGNKQVVFLKRGWVFANGISAGQNTASFSTISEFEAAQPIQKS